LYKLRPSAMHAPYRRKSNSLLRSGPFNEVETPPARLRWDPLPVPTRPTDFIDGLATFAGSGQPAALAGVAVHLSPANRSMTGRSFACCGGELMFVPPLGSVLIFSELGKLEVGPREIAVIPRGIKFKVGVKEPVRGYLCENYGAPFRLPELGPLGS